MLSLSKHIVESLAQTGLCLVLLLPVYPKSQVLQDRELSVQGREGKFVQHFCPAPHQEVEEFYIQSFLSQGWQERPITYAGEEGKQKVFNFEDRRGNSLQLMVIPATDIYSTAVLTYWTGISHIKEKEDTPGRDLSWLARFPDSQRVFYQKEAKTGLVSITYEIEDVDRQAVLDFYTPRLSLAGWVLEADPGEEDLSPGYPRDEEGKEFYHMSDEELWQYIINHAPDEEEKAKLCARKGTPHAEKAIEHLRKHLGGYEGDYVRMLEYSRQDELLTVMVEEKTKGEKWRHVTITFSYVPHLDREAMQRLRSKTARGRLSQ